MLLGTNGNDGGGGTGRRYGGAKIGPDAPLIDVHGIGPLHWPLGIN